MVYVKVVPSSTQAVYPLPRGSTTYIYIYIYIYIHILVPPNWYLFAYSRFAYFKTKKWRFVYSEKFGHPSDVKLDLEVGLSLKMYLGHVKVTSCAITGFVCTKSCSS